MNGFTNEINNTTGQVNVGAGQFLTNPANMPAGYKEAGQVNMGYTGSGDNNLKYQARREMSKPAVPAVIKELITMLPADHPLRDNLIKYENIILTIQRESVWNINSDDASPMALTAGTLYECWRSYKELQDVMVANNKVLQNIAFSKVVSDLFSNQAALDLLAANGFLNQDAVNTIVAAATDQKSPIDFTALVQGAMLELGAWLLRGMAVEYNVTSAPETIAMSIGDVLKKSTDKAEAEREIMNILASFGIIKQGDADIYMSNQFTYSLADRIRSLASKPKTIWSQDDWNYDQMVTTFLTTGQLPVEQSNWTGQQQPQQVVQQQPVMTTINGGYVVPQQPQVVTPAPVANPVPVTTQAPAQVNGSTLSSGTIINKGGPTTATTVTSINNNLNNQGGNQMQLTNYATSQNPGGYVTPAPQLQVPVYTNNGPQFNNQAFAPVPMANPAPAPVYGQPVAQPVYNQPVSYAPQAVAPQPTVPMANAWNTPTTANYTYNNATPVVPVYNNAVQQPQVPMANPWGGQNFNQPQVNNVPMGQFPQGLGSPNENDKLVTDRAILYYTVKDYGTHDPTTNSKYLSLIDPTTGLVEICTEFYYNTRRETLRNPAYGNRLLQLSQNKSAPVYGTPQIINLPDQPQMVNAPQPLVNYNQPIAAPAPVYSQPVYNQAVSPQAPNVMNGWNTNTGFNQAPVSTGMILPGYN